jgi:hypothetical protein
MQEKKEKEKRGRPPKFKSVKELERKIAEYFQKREENEKPLTITGLALALDTTRGTLLEYQGRGGGFGAAIRRAKARCEQYAEDRLFGSKQCTGAIFTLKNNYGWNDIREEKGSHDISIKIIDRFEPKEVESEVKKEDEK